MRIQKMPFISLTSAVWKILQKVSKDILFFRDVRLHKMPAMPALLRIGFVFVVVFNLWVKAQFLKKYVTKKCYRQGAWLSASPPFSADTCCCLSCLGCTPYVLGHQDPVLHWEGWEAESAGLLPNLSKNHPAKGGNKVAVTIQHNRNGGCQLPTYNVCTAPKDSHPLDHIFQNWWVDSACFGKQEEADNKYKHTA